MHLSVPAAVIGCLMLTGGVAAAEQERDPQATPPAQTATQKPAPPTTQKPATPAPAAPAPAAAQAAAPVEMPTHSLFSQTWRQAQISGRLSSVSGDPARFQRYQDIRDGLLVTDVRYARDDQDPWQFRVGADNIGFRDQRFFGTYERTGKFVLSGLWDEIPQFYSVDTKTPYTPAPGVSPLTLDDNVQRSIQNAQADRNAYIPIATQFDLRERRDIGTVTAKATPTQEIDIKAAFTTTKHTGQLPWGASFGFSNDVEVAVPYASRTNARSVGAEWRDDRHMVRVAYDGSWFDNLDDTLVWDSPLRLDDASGAPGRGRMALWPSNSSQTFSVGGYSKFDRRTQVTGYLAFGFRNNDEPLQPFTINSTLPQLTLPRATTEGSANTFTANISLVSRPIVDWRFSARLYTYSYDNQAPQTLIPEFINYDSSITTSSTGGPELFAHSRTTFDADATWTGLLPFAFTAGYGYRNGGYDFRIFESTGENVLTLKADAIGWQWATFRANYEYSDRNGSGLDEDLLIELGEQPAMRHYDLADRTRNRFTGQVDVTPNEAWVVSASLGTGKDNFSDSYFGLQKSTFRTFTLAADYQRPDGLGAGASYDYERYAGLQRSRTASPGQTPDQVTDPNRDWTTDSTERVHYYSFYVTPPRIGQKTEARFSYEYAHSRGNYVYGVVPGGPVPVPAPLPEVFNKLQELKIDIRHRLSRTLVATLSYLYEPYDVYDFAFDPSVIDSIVQPSSLVLGYVTRPYTAHSVVFGVRVFW